MDHDTLTFYQSGIFTQKWRWRYQAAGNGENLANGGQGYKDRDWALKSAYRVCGLGNPFDDFGDFFKDKLVYSPDDPDRQVMVRFR
jgi:hypothetical protein